MKFKENEPIQILDKTTGDPLEEWAEKGDLGIVSGIIGDKYTVSVPGYRGWSIGTYNESDLAKLPIGTEVEIISKSIGSRLGVFGFIRGAKGYICDNRFDLSDCEGPYDYGIVLNKTLVNDRDSGSFFRFNDFKVIKLPPFKSAKSAKSYKFKRPFAPLFLIKRSNATLDEISKFCIKMKEFGYQKEDVVIMSDKFIDYIKSHSCMWDWFLENYIEECDSFTPFSVTFDIKSKKQYQNLKTRLYCTKTLFKDYEYHEDTPTSNMHQNLVFAYNKYNLRNL